MDQEDIFLGQYNTPGLIIGWLYQSHPSENNMNYRESIKMDIRVTLTDNDIRALIVDYLTEVENNSLPLSVQYSDDWEIWFENDQLIIQEERDV